MWHIDMHMPNISFNVYAQLAAKPQEKKEKRLQRTNGVFAPRRGLELGEGEVGCKGCCKVSVMHSCARTVSPTILITGITTIEMCASQG